MRSAENQALVNNHIELFNEQAKPVREWRQKQKKRWKVSKTQKQEKLSI